MRERLSVLQKHSVPAAVSTFNTLLTVYGKVCVPVSSIGPGVVSEGVAIPWDPMRRAHGRSLPSAEMTVYTPNGSGNRPPVGTTLRLGQMNGMPAQLHPNLRHHMLQAPGEKEGEGGGCVSCKWGPRGRTDVCWDHAPGHRAVRRDGIAHS